MHAWLTTLARHLRDTSTRHGWSPTDLYLDDLWPTAGWRTPRYAASAFKIAIFAAIALLVALPAAQDGTLTEVRTLAVLAMVGLGSAAVGWLSLDPDPDLPDRLDLRQVRTSAGRNRLAANLFGFLALGIAMGFLIGFATGIAVGLAVGVTGGLAGGLSAIERPSDLMRQSLAFDLLQGLALGTAIVLSIMITTKVTSFGIAVGLLFGFALGLVLGFGTSRWPRYWIACALAIPRRRLPPRPSLFLDWAYAAGLLRLSGIGTQFRHREFQQWLESGTGSP